jgi:hypothetical protein
LRQQLLDKFLQEYGYERGPLVAAAIVDDILALIDERYSDQLPPRYVNWPAVPVKNGRSGKSKAPQIRNLVNVRLQIVTDEEVALLDNPALRQQQAARRTFNQQRFARWCQEAYDQGGVLTLLELSLLSGLSANRIGVILRQYEQENSLIVPIRGTVHDLGSSVTHKTEVIRRYLQGQSPADIAYELNHSQASVDAYIQGYDRVRKLAQKFPLEDLPVLAGYGKHLICQYLKLMDTYEPDLELFSSTSSISTNQEPGVI